MVGVPSSKGCALCLKRSIKCDEARPSCSQCRRGLRKCPGYVRGVKLKFMDEGPKLRRSLARASGRTRAAELNPPDPRGDPDGQSSGAPVCMQNPAGPGNDAPLELKSLSLERQQLVFSFISAMFPLGVASVQRSFLGSWLWHIPARLNGSRALDYAALSVALAYFARTSSAAQVLHNAQLAYTLALRYLAAAIADGAERAGSDVLCATMLLGHYESFVNVDTAWIRHAGGAARLLRLRGARRCYESAFDYAIFLACRGSIIAESLASGEPCFLEEKEWQSIPDGLIDFPLLPQSSELWHDVFGLFAKVPGLVTMAKGMTDHTPESERLSILSSAEKVRGDLKQWHERYTSNQEVCPVLNYDGNADASFEEALFRPAYVYKDVPSASVITTYCAYLIILNGAIDMCSSSNTLLAKESFESAMTIYRSVEFCSRAGYCGTQVMRFSLPIARGALPVEYHGWIDNWLSRFQSAHESRRLRIEVDSIHAQQAREKTTSVPP
ncbi:hypothetical protein PG984_012053 [Apiospora sp. TS-2023a]